MHTGLSKRRGDKLGELRKNFPKLSDWAVHWLVTLPGRTGAGIFKQGTFLLHIPLHQLLSQTHSSRNKKQSKLLFHRKKVKRARLFPPRLSGNIPNATNAAIERATLEGIRRTHLEDRAENKSAIELDISDSDQSSLL